MSTAYADVSVELTNLYNLCDLDYYMQAFAPIFTQLSGFLGFGTSLLGVIISLEEGPNYTCISKGVYDENHAMAGSCFGIWFKHLMGIEL